MFDWLGDFIGGIGDAIGYLSAHQNRHALCMCIEKALGLEVPERAVYIRTIMVLTL